MPFESITKRDAQEAIDAVERIETFVLEKIDIPGESDGLEDGL